MIITLDFETGAIAGNPHVYPPKPCGLAIYTEGYEPHYIHEWDKMRGIWTSYVAESTHELLFHNSSFDLSVGCHWFETPRPHWSRVHDTLFLAFIKDPYSPTLSLKPLAERYLGLSATEQDELHEWILRNVPESTEKTAGAFISRAPVDLVAKYAKGDVLRTRQLFDLLRPQVPTAPYDRERRLSPKLSESSRHGIRVDRERLCKDLEICDNGYKESERLIFDSLGSRPFDVSKGAELAEALDRAGKISQWSYTPTGKKSLARDNLVNSVNDPTLLDLLSYHSMMKTCLTVFMRPWERLSAADGRLHTEWNQTASDYHGDGHKVGTRTGRLSSMNPNFQNPPNEFKFTVPETLAAYPLPLMRSYLLPEEGHVWIKRDFSSQEVRILAHFEDGTIMEMYRSDPFFDPHQFAKELIEQITGMVFDRKDVKIVGFSIIYGSGVPGLAAQLGSGLEKAKVLRDAYFKALPSIPELAKSTSARGRSGGCITTWGGRQYYVEAPKVIGGRVRSFEYKLLNYLIQGSAADQTKEVICNWWEDSSREAIFMATVHDEVNASAPEESWRREMLLLRNHMDADMFDVPMRSEGEYGPSWGKTTKLKGEYQ